MYVPHLSAILKNVGLTKEEFETSSAVKVPMDLLKFLLQIVVANGEFNAVGYLSNNPDIAKAVQEGRILNPKLHYVQYGFFEGRLGATPDVNEDWYKHTYKDVADAISSGALTSASEHFLVQGAAEGRSPNEKCHVDSVQWKSAFGVAP